MRNGNVPAPRESSGGRPCVWRRLELTSHDYIRRRLRFCNGGAAKIFARPDNFPEQLAPSSRPHPKVWIAVGTSFRQRAQLGKLERLSPEETVTRNAEPYCHRDDYYAPENED
jgi:hypothetical protein